MSNRLKFLVLALSACASAPQMAHAVTTVGPNTGPGGCTYRTIQEAINHVIQGERDPANNDQPWDITIGVANGTYTENLSFDDSGISDARGAWIQIVGGMNGVCDDQNWNATNSTGTQIDAQGRGSAINVRGHGALYVQALTLMNGDGGSAGGGIDFQGSGLLDTAVTDIAFNSASRGGGINARGTAAPGLTVNLRSGTSIHSNAASAGGGLYADGAVSLSAIEGNVAIILNTSSGTGGGMAFEGHGDINLLGTAVWLNTAGSDGGGIYINSEQVAGGGTATAAQFFDNVSILSNVTTGGDGGGLYLGGPVVLTTNSPTAPTTINDNVVQNSSKSGGGAFVIAPAKLTFTGAIEGNTSAGNGGGIAVLSNVDDDTDTSVRLKAANGSSPVSISNNSAHFKGGGIFSRATLHSAATTTVSDFLLNGNTAAEGTAFFGQTDTEFGDVIVSGPLLTIENRGQCIPQIACNEIKGNFQTGGTSENGSTLLIPDGAVLFASRIKIQANQGAHVLSSVGGDIGSNSMYKNNLNMVLISDNSVGGELLSAVDQLTIESCTIAHNAIGAAHVIRSPNITLEGSIVAENVTNTIDYAGNASPLGAVDYNLTNASDLTIPVGQANFFGDPEFVSVAAQNYHLRPTSLAIDVAPVTILEGGAVESQDFELHPRNVDQRWLTNYGGPRDLGVFELQDIDAIFIDGFDP